MIHSFILIQSFHISTIVSMIHSFILIQSFHHGMNAISTTTVMNLIASFTK